VQFADVQTMLLQQPLGCRDAAKIEKSGVVLKEEPQPRWANEPSYLI